MFMARLPLYAQRLSRLRKLDSLMTMWKPLKKRGSIHTGNSPALQSIFARESSGSFGLLYVAGFGAVLRASWNWRSSVRKVKYHMKASSTSQAGRV